MASATSPPPVALEVAEALDSAVGASYEDLDSASGSETNSDVDSLSGSSSAKSIPNVLPARNDRSGGISASGGLSSTPRSIFKMKKTGRVGLLQPSSSQHNLITAKSQSPFPKSHSSPNREATGRHDDLEPEPALIASDIMLQATPPKPPKDGRDQLGADTRGKGSLASTTKKQRAADDPAGEEEKKRARAERLSIQMKERWASGRMDAAIAKRMETLKRQADPNSPGAGQRTPKRQARQSLVLDAGQRSAHSEPGTSKMLDTPSPKYAHKGSALGDNSLREPRHPSRTTHGDTNELWEYIRPRLTLYTSPEIPTTGYVDQLINLPRVRNLHWNTKWLTAHPFKDFKTKDISAMIIQVTGRVGRQPCTRCEKGTGPFRGCVMMSTDAPKKVASVLASCANCTYHYGDRLCSERTSSTEQPARGSIAHDTRSAGSIVGEQADVAGDADIDEGDSLVWNATTQVARRSKERRWSEPSAGDQAANGVMRTPRPPAIEAAPSGRPYASWPDKSGQLVGLHGALLPDEYELDESVSGRPWVCPIDTCRRVFMTRNTLGFHFSRVHYGDTLNDNGDGTFTITGQYDEKHIAKGGGFLTKDPSLPLVVSQNPRDEASLDPLQPRLPKYLQSLSLPHLIAESTPSTKDESGLDLQDEAPSPRRQPERIFLTEHELEDEKDGDADHEEHPKSRPFDHSSVDGVVASTATRAKPQQSHEITSASVISMGQVQPTADVLEMEEWEIAPGRIRTEDADHSDNVALSKAYLTANQSVQICRGFAFRVEVINSGSTLRLEPDAETTRICSVASGKLRVGIDGEPKFVIGPHGLFKIRPGTACSVQNRLYIDAVVHVSSVAGCD